MHTPAEKQQSVQKNEQLAGHTEMIAGFSKGLDECQKYRS